jgi:signal transduction histidine kinase
VNEPAATPPVLRAGPPPEERILFLAGRFDDAALEREFRQANAEEWGRSIRVVALVAAILIPAAGFLDFRLLGWGPALAALWAVRAALAVLCLGVALGLRSPVTVPRLDAGALVLMLAIAVFVMARVLAVGKGIEHVVPGALLAVISFYVFIPARFGFQLGGAAALSVLFLGAELARGASPLADWATALAQTLICNLLGIHAALRSHDAARREFLGLRREVRRKEQLRQSVAALEKSNAELEQFAYVASHDLQSPLRNVISFAQLLQRRYREALGDKGAEYLDTIQQSAGHMHSLITDLLAFSRVGRSGHEPQAVDTAAVLADVEQVLAARIRETGAQVTHDPLPVVTGSPTEVRQLLQNLVDNGIKFQREGAPRVHVSARPSGGFWEFAVRDHGIGIRAEHQERIFQMFERLHDGADYAGTGIGLAICRKIVEHHGGRIWVESEPGAGATFHFTLPARAAA